MKKKSFFSYTENLKNVVLLLLCGVGGAVVLSLSGVVVLIKHKYSTFLSVSCKTMEIMNNDYYLK